ncbi:hypothetical protein [Synechococcus sp. CS-1328]|uniref:hypothetical protein n=1 Tax=Synechococcus sp. CS-1328 TaxID=2847976 RepID=UPI00223BE14F|nr:hypothetical protein [Synechococcus sp. CS-1328]MCT0224801.1 hypothetical protein [Synechococcus sp. CS-1328]
MPGPLTPPPRPFPHPPRHGRGTALGYGTSAADGAVRPYGTATPYGTTLPKDNAQAYGAGPSRPDSWLELPFGH